MIKQEHYIIHPRHSGETKIGCYMTLIIREINDIETKYQHYYQQHLSIIIQTSNHFLPLHLFQMVSVRPIILISKIYAIVSVETCVYTRILLMKLAYNHFQISNKA